MKKNAISKKKQQPVTSRIPGRWERFETSATTREVNAVRGLQRLAKQFVRKIEREGEGLTLQTQRLLNDIATLAVVARSETMALRSRRWPARRPSKTPKSWRACVPC